MSIPQGGACILVTVSLKGQRKKNKRTKEFRGRENGSQEKMGSEGEGGGGAVIKY